ncbi:MAG TPA: selenoneine biosynthesis selenosugar synthase SenB [Burkholderiaceae bacterium]|nr:selenoneine biosynthesis selenosugar synthase SenB [Burkholderiaceae bacterium]
MRECPLIIVSPALASSNNGNWHTASRWQKFLSAIAPTVIAQHWHDEPAAALVALHARRSAESIARFREAHPTRPLALLLTGTDLYRDLASDESARHSMVCASHLVVLQAEALHRLNAADRAKARVIVQSASRRVRRDQAVRTFDFVAVGHLRAEKDPLTLMRAACLLPGSGNLRVVHIGAALDAELGAQARRTMRECSAYRWQGELAHSAARRWIARSRAVVHTSILEGGANVVVEAICSQVPVLASRIDGNVGLLGRDYDGYFAPGDATELNRLMRRMHDEPAFAEHLQRQCALRAPCFAPEAEAAAVRGLLMEMLGAGVGRNEADS